VQKKIIARATQRWRTQALTVVHQEREIRRAEAATSWHAIAEAELAANYAAIARSVVVDVDDGGKLEAPGGRESTDRTKAVGRVDTSGGGRTAGWTVGLKGQ